MSIEKIFGQFKRNVLTYRQAVYHLTRRGLSMGMIEAILCRAE